MSEIQDKVHDYMMSALMRQQADMLIRSTANTAYISDLTTSGWTGTDYVTIIPQTQLPSFTVSYGSTGGEFKMAYEAFDEKKPWGLFQISTGVGQHGLVGWFATENAAVAEAETRITGDKSVRFVVLKALRMIEAEPVKTRQREL